MIRHYLQPLLAPRSVALVGATERKGAIGNIVYRNLAADSSLELFAVNPQVIEDAGAAGIRAAAVLTSGFGEADEHGKKLQEEMLSAARRGGVRILGPNSLGIMRTHAADHRSRKTLSTSSSETGM